MFLNNSCKHTSFTLAPHVPYRRARTFDDRLAAFQLVHRCYLESGLGVNNVFGMRITPYQLLETSQIFVACERKPTPSSESLSRFPHFPSDGTFKLGSDSDAAVIATVTLVGDGLLGLPMESMFAAEVAELRSQGRQLAEVTCLADSAGDPRSFLRTFTQLTRLMAQFSRHQGVQNLVISVHPRHAKFYARYFGFRPISDRVANCPHVKNQPAVGLNLDFDLFDREQPKSWYEIFGSRVPREKLVPCPIPFDEAEYLREVVDEIDCQRNPALKRVPGFLSEHFLPLPLKKAC